MPQFTVKRRADAVIVSTTMIEAPNAKQASRLACKNEADLEWKEDEAYDLGDFREFVTLDENSDEVDDTEVEG